MLLPVALLARYYSVIAIFSIFRFNVCWDQAALGECKKDKGNGSICLYVTIGGKKLVLGTLSSENVPQLSFDLVFERDFQLSHSGKNGSVHFIGYKVPQAEYPFSAAHHIVFLSKTCSYIFF